MAMGNNSLFTRWRPVAHFIAPAGWMNDPCGTMYDPIRDEYHVLYQWHPSHINWGNISWGAAKSKDRITWTDIRGWEGNEALALGPDPPGTYDGLGIFSGTAQPVNIHGEQDGTLTAFWTSVQHLPIGWSIPYIPDSETQSLATSSDGGLTWQKYDGNPIIPHPPGDWNITGWRDPFYQPWPLMDKILGQSEPHYYAVFGSGIRGVGPRMPFYSAPASDLTSWTFLGALWEPQMNTSLGSLLETGTYAFNFEVSGFFSLDDSKGDPHYFAQMGTEGGNVSFHESNHWALWNEGSVSVRSNGSLAFQPFSGGAGDWGNLYALTSFNDTKNNRRVQWGWSSEDMTDLFTQQGFQGCFALPRHLFVHEISGVKDTSGGEPGNSKFYKNSDGSYTATTLGVKPLPDVVAGITKGCDMKEYSCGRASGSKILGSGSTHYMLQAQLTKISGPVGFTVGASPNGEEYTHIYWEPSNNTVNVDRLHSTLIPEAFSNVTVVGYFKPYTMADGSTEAVDVTIFLDGSLLEIYINDRFALTTRIYPSLESSTGFGLYVPDGSSAQYEYVKAYRGLKDVFPKRPVNSSSMLVYDTPAQTDNYTWWTGN
jgi:beta-fructofuranosidase